MKIDQTNSSLESFRRRHYIFELALKLIEKNLRQKAKVNSLLKDLSNFLGQYREEDITNNEVVNPHTDDVSVKYVVQKKKNSITKLRCNTCKNSVCEIHSTPTCNYCQNIDLPESDDNV